VDGTGSGSCPVVGFGISGVEYLGRMGLVLPLLNMEILSSVEQ
jgi:hypothetical protein